MATSIANAGARVRLACLLAGFATLLAALGWPLPGLAGGSLAAHMVQHLLLLAVAPPLLLLALPATRARQLALVHPVTALLLQSAVMWGAHFPAVLEAAHHQALLHALMLGSFLLAGLLFWASVLRAARRAGTGAGGAIIALVGTMIQMGLLGALLTFAGEPRYPAIAGQQVLAGSDALADQQLAGLIMWVPGAVPYLAGIVLFAIAWLKSSADPAKGGTCQSGG